jgi:hypothetical protein
VVTTDLTIAAIDDTDPGRRHYCLAGHPELFPVYELAAELG